MERSLSEVMSMPWKLVRQDLPWTSSTRSLTLRKEYSSFLFKSARETSRTRPFKASLAFFMPWVGLTRVLPTLRTSKVEGALISYQSLRVKGSTLRDGEVESAYQHHRSLLVCTCAVSDLKKTALVFCRWLSCCFVKYALLLSSSAVPRHCSLTVRVVKV